MKIFNKENGVEKVYVQKNDLVMILHSEDKLPASICDNIFADGIFVVDGDNGNEFIEFSDKDSLKFFRSLDYVVDFKELSKLSKEELEEKFKEVAKERYENAKEYEKLAEKGDLRGALVAKENHLAHKMGDIQALYFNKIGENNIDFPVVPDSDGFSFVGDENFEYIIKSGLNPRQILLYRKDGKELQDDESIPLDFVNTGMAIAIMEKSIENVFVGDYSTERKLSEDRKYLITNIVIKEKKDNNYIEGELVEEESKKEKKNTKPRIFKKILSLLSKTEK